MRNLGSRKWPAEYAVCSTAKYSYEGEEKPYLDARVELGLKLDKPEHIFNSFFLRGIPGAEEHVRQTEWLRSFWGSMDLVALRIGGGEPGIKEIAVVDEGSQLRTSADDGDDLAYKGPLTATQLYNELIKERWLRNLRLPSTIQGPSRAGEVFYIPELNRLVLNSKTLDTTVLHHRHIAFGDDIPLVNVSTARRPRPGAERRLIYMPDLDRWGLLALVASVCNKRQQALQQTVRNYILSNPAIDVECTKYAFSLAFTLSFFAWRVSEKPQLDERMCNEEPLRTWIDVSFLVGSKYSGKKSPQKSYLYPACVSCIVAGTDHWVWDGYGFVDTYYEAADVRRDIASYDADYDTLPPGKRPDYIPAGEHLTDKSIWTPREYFLMVFESRMGDQVVKEWSDIVGRLKEAVQDYIKHDSGRGPRETESKRKSRLLAWTSKAKALLSSLTGVLEDTIECWDLFHQDAAAYFDGIEKLVAEGHMVRLVKAFQILKRYQRDLKKLESACDQLSRDFKLGIQVDDNQNFYLQQVVLLLTTVVFVPISLVANVFNVPGVVTFPINSRTFAIANLIMVVLVVVIVALWQPLGSLWQVIAATLAGSGEQESVADTKAENQACDAEDFGVKRLAGLGRRAQRKEDDPERGYSFNITDKSSLNG